MAHYSGQERFPASFETVNDGSGRDAAGVNVGLEALADRTLFLRNVGFRRVAFWSYDNQSSFRSWAFNSTTYSPNVTFPNDWVVTVPNTRVGDIIMVDASAFLNADATFAFWKIGATDNFTGGGTEVLTPGLVRLGGGAQMWATFTTLHTVAVAGTTRLRLLGRYEGSLNAGFSAAASGVLRAALFRSSGSAE
ncbi:uncharacterized protein SOCEGT47_057100 [Sorangium cellulosum]|uniref:Uncharacterized protein n=1 Tax=Sorangium cellulosum TaxID=56 RepID=A0A4P2Q7M5_SORCE|nr:hypothetical protein [Sorangium cellulosum]AUX25166.1 uncharacterized protein SOCEGT47_057100 [Sorangium cellulosum]